MCSGAAWSQCRFRHCWMCWSSDHVTGAARSIMCKRYGSEVVRVLSQWSNTNLTGQGSTISPSDSRLQCTTGISAGTSEIHRLHRRSGKLHRRPSSGSSHVCGRRSTYRVYNGFWHSECHHKNAKLCWSCTLVSCTSRRLQLTPAKTELIWFGSKASLKKTVHYDQNLYIGADIIKPVGVVRDLGFRQWTEHRSACIQTVVRSCFFYLRRLKSVWCILGREVTLGLEEQLCQLSWQPGLTTVTPFSQDFLRRQSIHFNESRTQLPDLLLELGHGITSLLFSEACTGFRSSCS